MAFAADPRDISTVDHRGMPCIMRAGSFKQPYSSRERFLATVLLICNLSIAAGLHAQESFPGYYVQHFNSDNGMPNTIKGMQADEKGFIWFATESGLVRFDGSRFTLYDHSDLGMPVSRLTGIGLTKTGNIYVEAGDGQYYHLTIENKLRSIPAGELFKDDNKSRLYTGFPSAIYAACKKKSDQHLIGEWAVPDLTQKNFRLFSRIACSKGFYYYINKNRELVAADTSLTRFFRFDLSRLQPVANDTAQRNTLLSSLLQGNREVYLRWRDSVYLLDFSPQTKNLSLQPLAYVGHIANIMGYMPLPRYHGYITGTITDGFYFFQQHDFSVERVASREENVYYAQAPFARKGVLTHAGVVWPDKFLPFKENFDYRFIMRSKDGSYYLYRKDQHQQGLWQLDSTGKPLHLIWPTTNRIFCLKELNDGSKWVSAENHFLGRLGKDSIYWFDRPPGLAPGFNVSDFMENGQNIFWIAGTKGLARIDLESNTLLDIPALRGIYIRNLYKDPRGTLWIGTYGNGFYAWYKNHLVALPLDRNHYLAYAHTFLPDQSGRLWISTNHGLFAFSLADLYRYLEHPGNPPYFYYFDHTAGFLTNEFNGGCEPAGIVLGNGRFSLPSLNGLVQFDPASIKPAWPDAEIFVDGIIADTASIPYHSGNLTIPSHTNRLLLSISSPYLGNEYNQVIQYRDGSSGNWYDLNKDGLIELNNLRSGRHTLQLRKQAGFGPDNIRTKNIDFYVQPAFVETPLFKLIAALLLASLLYAIYRIRIRLLTQQKARLEKEVREKTKEQISLIENLEIVVSELEASQTDLQKTLAFKETLAMIIAHDLQSPLRFLSDAMQRLHEKNKRQPDPEARELSGELLQTSSEIAQFVEDFSIWAKRGNARENLNLEAVNVYGLLAELEQFFNALQKSRKNKIIVRALPAIYVYTDYQLLKAILRNLIDNANKHTYNGNIHITLTAKEGSVSIEIADSGEGMRPEILARLVKRIQGPKPAGYAVESGMGFGYRIITDFCRLAGISLDIQSGLNTGTTITLTGLEIAGEVPEAAVVSLSES